ncbi:uncharacterized protein LOC133534221 [Cydia pomonella]|uniref:uncharacterized protein LOC133534221 n=1 Tax=Cydia pomonella TaxID=82600 RepID=UPI002ADE8353|nr:uncharacterized protein LOC133534221 [Cydia pomonella]
MVKCCNCSRVVNIKAPGAQCNKCSKWWHASCASLSTEQLSALSVTDSIDWKCPKCVPIKGAAKKRISVILPDREDEESEAETTTNNEADKVLMEMRQEIRQLRQAVKDIIQEELKRTLNFYSDKIDEFESRMKDYETKFKLMENQCKDVANTCKNLVLKNELLEQKLHKSEQAQVYNDIEICGVAEKENEDVKKVATSLCQLLNQDPNDIIRTYRKKKPTRPGSAQAERAKMDSPITVTLREGRRDHWYDAAKSARITAQDIGGEEDRKVYLRESLTPTTSYLLWKAKTNLRDKSLCQYVWYKHGQVMVRKKDGDKKIYYIRNEKDIERVGKDLQKT